MAWESPPIAVCTSCGAPLNVSNFHLKQERCGRRFHGERCQGTYEGSTLKWSDWKTCSACGGTGVEGNGRCELCQGSGWYLTRERPIF